MRKTALGLTLIAADWRRRDGVLTRLRRHPLPIDARLQDCLTLTYALPADVLERLLPPGLELETMSGYGFAAVALVRATALRPAGLPEGCGKDFFLAGYRIFCRFTMPDGRRLRGLRILRSDAKPWPMVVGGNLLTHYNYHLCDAAVDRTAHRIEIVVQTGDGYGDVAVAADLTDPALPPGSPFSSVREARRFAGPLPFTFDYEPQTHSIVAIRGSRTRWRPAPIAVDVKRIGFFDQSEFAGCTPILAAAFHVTDVNYRWERGVRYPLTDRAIHRRNGRRGDIFSFFFEEEKNVSLSPLLL